MTLLTTMHAVAGILKDANRVLVAERPMHKPAGGFWEFPGGKIEQDETSLQALSRELQEEIGVTIDAESAHLLVTLHNSYSFAKHVYIDVFLVTKWIGTPTALENQRLRYCTLDDMQSPTFKTQFLPGLETILTHLTPYFENS